MVEPVSSPARVIFAEGMRTRAERRHARQRKVAYAKRCIRQNEGSWMPRESPAQEHRRASKWADNMDVHGAHCLCKTEKHQQLPTASLRRRVDSAESSNQSAHGLEGR